MRMVLACVVLMGLSGVAAAQSLDDFSGISMEFGFGDTFEAPPPPPIVYGGCLMAEDGLTPVVCKDSDMLHPVPEGFSWRDDPEARVGAPQHCLWWEAGESFLGLGINRVCREGTLASEDIYDLRPRDSGVLESPEDIRRRVLAPLPR